MFFCVLAFIYISILAFIYGSASAVFIHRLFRLEGEPESTAGLICIIGLVVLALTAGYLSFFIKIGLWANVFVLATAGVLLLRYRDEIHRNTLLLRENAGRVKPVVGVIFALLCVIMIIEVTDIPRVGDSGLYHVQTIKWIESYRVVPGLGNLHGFFAWNSMWYPLAALFGFSFFGIQTLHVINGTFYLFALAFFLGGVMEILNGEYRVTSLIKAAAIPFSLFVYKPQIGSPATDLPAALLIWIALLLILEKPNLPVQPDTRIIISLILSTYAMTVKVSAVPLILLWVFFIYQQIRSGQFAIIGYEAALVAAILIPWLGRNIILSGYLVYPIAYIDLFRVDWKLPYQYVLEEKLVAHGWARLPGPDWKASLAMPFPEWTTRWYGWLPYHYKTAITTMGLITFAQLGAAATRPGIWLRRIKSPDTFLLVYLTALLGVLYWFINAPDPRFGFGFIFLALILPITPLMLWFSQKYPAAARQIMLSILLIYTVNHGLLSVRLLPKNASILLSPLPYPSEALETQIIDNTILYFPIKTDQCWYAPLPCMPVLNDGLQLRGDTLQSGFKIAHKQRGFPMIDHPLRILQVNTEDQGGGAAMVAWNLFQAYRACGHESWIAVGQKQSQDPHVIRLADLECGSGWRRFWKAVQSRLHPLEGRAWWAGWANRRAGVLAEPGKSLDGYLGREDFRFPETRRLMRLTPAPADIIHGHNLHGGFFDLRKLPALSRQAPLILTLHDAWLLSGHCAHSFECERWQTGCGRCPDLTIYPAIQRDGTASNWRRKQAIYARSRLSIATPSHWLMQKVERSMLAPAVMEGRVIPNGIDLTLFQPGDKDAARARLGIPQDAIVLLFTANNVRSNLWKDYQTVREAIIHVAEALHGQEVLLIALGEEAPSERIGQAEARFISYQKDPTAVAGCYQAADVYVHAARADTFPNTILEALACGTPVIATAVGGIPEQIEDGRSGFLVPLGDAQAMADRIVQVLSDEHLKYRLGCEAAEVARGRFDLSQQVDAYLSWYSELVSRRASLAPKE